MLSSKHIGESEMGVEGMQRAESPQGAHGTLLSMVNVEPFNDLMQNMGGVQGALMDDIVEDMETEGGPENEKFDNQVQENVYGEIQ